MSEEGLHFKHGLAAAFLIMGVPIGLVFMTPSMTGNAIGNLTNTASTGIGVMVVMASMALGFFLSRD